MWGSVSHNSSGGGGGGSFLTRSDESCACLSHTHGSISHKVVSLFGSYRCFSLARDRISISQDNSVISQTLLRPPSQWRVCFLSKSQSVQHVLSPTVLPHGVGLVGLSYSSYTKAVSVSSTIASLFSIQSLFHSRALGELYLILRKLELMTLPNSLVLWPLNILSLIHKQR